MNKISFDIDGVLTDYPNHWLSWLRDETGFSKIEIHDIPSAKKALLQEYQKYKTYYRNSEAKYLQPVKSDVQKAIQFLLSAGYEIAFATDRPFETYPAMYDLTKAWLKRNDFGEVTLNSKSTDFFLKFKPDLHIDDQISRTSEIAREFSWIRCLLLSADSTKFTKIGERMYSTNSEALLFAITQISGTNFRINKT